MRPGIGRTDPEKYTAMKCTTTLGGSDGKNLPRAALLDSPLVIRINHIPHTQIHSLLFICGALLLVWALILR